MAELMPLAAPGESLAGAELPYRVELWDGPDGPAEQVVARSRSPGMGFAAYYAALQEYLGRHVVLRRGRDVLASSQPRRA